MEALFPDSVIKKLPSIQIQSKFQQPGGAHEEDPSVECEGLPPSPLAPLIPEVPCLAREHGLHVPPSGSRKAVAARPPGC